MSLTQNINIQNTATLLKGLTHLCESINLQPEVRAQVLHFCQEYDFTQAEEYMNQLFIKETWTQGRTALKELFAPDSQGIKMLTCMLVCALKTQEKYREAGIPEDIFIETFRCFPRFVGESRESYGEYRFDRDFWTVRQLSMQLFRIGAYEYELLEEEGRKAVSLHIPSDVGLDTDSIKASCLKAGQFLKQYFPDYAQAPFVCESWLLAPALRELLSSDSNIIKFQNLFTILKIEEDDREFLGWVYKDASLPIEKLPENTTLQRKIKQFLLAGGKVGAAVGELLPF